MRAAARLGWRVAAVVAFGATAALAVTLTRGAPMHAALISARSHDAAPRCAASGLRISLGAVPATGVHRGPTSYALDFTNVSDAKCELRGYPAVAAYLASGAQVGNAAAADSTAAPHRVVLAPGETARAAVIASAAGSASAAAGGCRPVIATGLRVTPPGESAARFIRHSLLACSAAGPRAPVFLRVRAVQLYAAAGKLDSFAQPASRPRIRSRAARVELRRNHRTAGTPASGAPGEPVLASGLTG
jgi:Protein of unknown function (DUF4232)